MRTGIKKAANGIRKATTAPLRAVKKAPLRSVKRMPLMAPVQRPMRKKQKQTVPVGRKAARPRSRRV